MAGHDPRPSPRDLLPVGGRTPEEHRTPGAVAPARLRASWQRSRGYGVSPERPRPVFVGAIDTDSLFYECGSEVLRGLARTVANEPISFMATDADGLVLLRICEDESITRSLDRVHLAPGFGFDERAAGTNGLGLALADRTASLVRAGDHFCAELRAYTCAAVPVTAPGGELAGSINLTTWSDASSELLLALAQAAAGTTAALMQARSGGTTTSTLHRGEVYRMVVDGWPGHGPDPCSSRPWRQAVAKVRDAMRSGRVVALVGEPGVGKGAAAARALREVRPGHQVVRARWQAGGDAAEWLTRWSPELAVRGTTLVTCGLAGLPAWAAEEFAAGVRTVGTPAPLVIAAHAFDDIPRAVADLVGAVVEVPPLRQRPGDILPLAAEFAHQERRRDIEIAPNARNVLLGYDWPGNAAQLRAVMRGAATRTDVVEAAHLPAEIFTGRPRPMTRLERVEREEIVRCLTEPGVSVTEAAEALGLSRATLYRKLAHYGLELPGRGKA
jgi:sigma-54 dependent transcriptional regulator, acetoin dehydrogenase operon transcriptional activator AcoR